MTVYYAKDGVTVRDSLKEDINPIASNIRQSDKNEIWKSHRHSPQDALNVAFSESILCFTVTKDGIPIAMFGCVPNMLLSDKASVWLLGTDKLTEIQTKFIRLSKKFIGVMLEHYSYLYNFVDVDNYDSRRWLKWCGFKLGQVIPYGIDKTPFQYFCIRSNSNV